jgi:hypothetical protein
LTLFQGVSQVLSRHKTNDDKRLALLDGIERAVQSVNLQLGSLRRSQILIRSSYAERYSRYKKRGIDLYGVSQSNKVAFAPHFCK